MAEKQSEKKDAAPKDAPKPQPSKAIQVSKPIQALSGTELVEFCRQKPEEAARTIHNLMVMNTGEMPGTLFVRRDKEGLLKRVKVGVVLRESKKQLVEMWTGGGKTLEITALGYRELNSVAGLHIITPAEVVVNGVRQPNPYVEIDPTTRNPVAVFCRKVVVGPSQMTGSMTATDTSLRFDLSTYLLEAILAKCKSLKESATNFARYGKPNEPPPEGAVKDASWSYFPILATVGIWVNMGHHEFGAVMSNHVSKLKFAERIAQTICERNGLKAHPGMTASVTAQNGIGTVLMTAWQQSQSKTDLDDLRRVIDSNTLADRADIEIETVEVEAGGSDVDRADADEAAEDSELGQRAEAGEKGEGPKEPDGRIPPEEMAKKVAAAMEAAATLAEALGPKKAKEKLRELGLEGDLAEATPEQLDKLIALKT